MEQREPCLWHLPLHLLLWWSSFLVPHVFWGLFEDVEIFYELLVYFENTRAIPTPVDVIWRGPDSSELFIEHLGVAFLAQLMGSVYPDEVVGVQESFTDILPEHEACSPLGDTESLHVSLRVAPHEVGERTLMRNLLYSLDRFDVID